MYVCAWLWLRVCLCAWLCGCVARALAYTRWVWPSDPSTSFGEDYGFAERALDAGYRLRTLDNIDGTFVYVRHGKAGPGDTRTQAAGNTWQISAELQQALLRNLKPIHTPLWLSPTSHDFFDLLHRQALQQAAQERVLRADKVATKAPAVKAAAPTKSHPNGALNYHLCVWAGGAVPTVCA